MKSQYYALLFLCLHFLSCDNDDDKERIEPPSYFDLQDVNINGKQNSTRYVGVPISTVVKLSFSKPVDRESAHTSISFAKAGSMVPIELSFEDNDSTVVLTPNQELAYLTRYSATIGSELTAVTGSRLRSETILSLVTQYDPSQKFAAIEQELLLTLVQQQTFKYFWELAEPMSGMARERNNSGDLVTSGGSGFGLMAIIVAIERQFITREEGLARLAQILSFLELSDRFHGVYPHWINGKTGKVIPFSANDNGADLVETAFLMQGLLTFRQYLNELDSSEKTLIDRINALWEAVEWDWFRRDGQDVLYWHWSPDKEWAMNHRISGHNETLITYVLAASSPTHPIPATVYHNGYARGGEIVNGNAFYGLTLPLGEAFGGPLFFSHYSFLGLDPRNLSDTYANYWTQNVNHTLINQEYAKANPKDWAGYSESSWGLTASDNQQGYSAHSPTNDLGVISPTAALSSFPYTPEESMKALEFFYYVLGDRLWGEYGFYDAYNLSVPWIANSYLAIDQGPIIVMIENYRTGLLWDLFMSAPEVQAGLTKLGFQY